MAFTANTNWEVQTGGNDANGGGFDWGVTGMLTDGAATSATGNSPVFSSASYNFDANDVGHWLCIKSGTNWYPGFYKIASVASNVATLTASVGLGTNLSGIISTVAGVASTASPTTATWSIDYSQSSTIKYSFTDITGTSTAATSALTPFTKNMIGNIINVTSGTGITAARAAIVSISVVTATLDKTIGATYSAGVGTLGGCLASPAQSTATDSSTGCALNGNAIFIGTGTYSTDCTATTNTSGARIDTARQVGGSGIPFRIIGYGTTRGDNTTTARPILQASTTGTTNSVILKTQGTFTYVANLELDCNYKTGMGGYFNSQVASDFLVNCIVRNTSATGYYAVNQCKYIDRLYATGCSYTSGTVRMSGGGSVMTDSAIIGNFTDGIRQDGSSLNTIIRCIVSGNTGDGMFATQTMMVKDCTFYNNTKSGIRLDVSFPTIWLIYNSLFYGNAFWGIQNNDNSAIMSIVDTCAFGSNTSGAIQPVCNAKGTITITADPFIAKASNDFRLNNVAGGGGVCKNVGTPTVYQGITLSAQYLDVGGCQSKSIIEQISVG